MPFKVEKIVSLGAWCQTVHQIRRMFGGSVLSPYDWLVTPLEALILSLADKGQYLGHEIVLNKDNIAICNRYGLLHFHDFELDSHHRSILTEAALKQCREKMSHKFNAMTSECTGRNTLFVRFGGFANPPTPNFLIKEEALVGSHDVNRLVDVLTSTFPETPFRLLFITSQAFARVYFDRSMDRRVITVQMPPDPPDVSWMGTDRFWNNLIRDSGLQFATVHD